MAPNKRQAIEQLEERLRRLTEAEKPIDPDAQKARERQISELNAAIHDVRVALNADNLYGLQGGGVDPAAVPGTTSNRLENELCF